MTIHSSLRGADALVGERSVLSRTERIQKLAKEGRIDPAKGSAWGLPKVRTKFKVAGKKKTPAPEAAASTPVAAAPAVPADATKKAPAADKKAEKKK
jgi:small basic protein (TIGR04137 family)